MLSKQQQTQAETHLSKFLDNASEIEAAVVSTIDGNMCAMRQRKNYPLERLATMGSTLMSLGDTITAELEMGSCKNIISENEGGIITFMHINDLLVLVTTTTDKKALGMLLAHSRRCADELNKLLS